MALVFPSKILEGVQFLKIVFGKLSRFSNSIKKFTIEIDWFWILLKNLVKIYKNVESVDFVLKLYAVPAVIYVLDVGRVF